jgi:hypothetical protein
LSPPAAEWFDEAGVDIELVKEVKEARRCHPGCLKVPIEAPRLEQGELRVAAPIQESTRPFVDRLQTELLGVENRRARSRSWAGSRTARRPRGGMFPLFVFVPPLCLSAAFSCRA